MLGVLSHFLPYLLRCNLSLSLEPAISARRASRRASGDSSVSTSSTLGLKMHVIPIHHILLHMGAGYPCSFSPTLKCLVGDKVREKSTDRECLHSMYSPSNSLKVRVAKVTVRS